MPSALNSNFGSSHIPDMTIYSVGDVDFLTTVINAVAMITSHSSFGTLVSVGLLVGVLLTFFDAMVKGAQKIEIGSIFVSLLLFMVFFGPQADVTIEDYQGTNVQQVSNVPIGLAFTGSLLSTVGKGITDLMETAFSPITSSGTMKSGDTLKYLSDLRKGLTSNSSLNDAVFASIDDGQSAHTDSKKTLYNYILDCTLLKVDLGVSTSAALVKESVMGGSAPNQGLQFNSDLYMTNLIWNSSSPSGDYTTCSNAWSTVEAIANSIETSPAIDDVIGVSIGNESGSPSTVATNALSLLNLSAISAQDFIRNAVIQPVYEQAVQGRYEGFQDFSSAIAFNQAIQQRNTQWASEGSMFVQTMRPLMSFFEAFLYAITPFMALAFALGSFGFKIAGKYLQSALWIQLWMPMSAVVNLFVVMSAEGAMSNLQAYEIGGHGSMASFYALNTLGQTTSTWVSVGGMLIASVPVISLFLVTGSTYAFSGLASRLSGQDHFDEKTNAPSALQSGAVLNSTGMYQGNPTSGVAMSGSDSMMQGINLSSAMSAGQSSIQQNAVADSQSLMKALTKGITNKTSGGDSWSKIEAFGTATTGMQGSSSDMISNKTAQIMDEFGIGGQHEEAVKGAVAASLGGGSPAGIVATIKGNLEDSTGDKISFSTGDSSKFAEMLSSSDAEQLQFADQFADRLDTSAGQSFLATLDTTDAQQISDSAAQTRTSTQMSAESQQFSDNAAIGTDLNAVQAGAFISNEDQSKDLLNQYRQNHAPNGSLISKNMKNLDDKMSQYSENTSANHYGSQVAAMLNRNNFDNDDDFSHASSVAMKALGLATGVNYQDGAPEQQSVGGVDNSKLSTDMESIEKDVNAAADNNSTGAQQGTGGNVPNAKEEFKAQFEQNSDQVKDEASASIMKNLRANVIEGPRPTTSNSAQAVSAVEDYADTARTNAASLLLGPPGAFTLGYLASQVRLGGAASEASDEAAPDSRNAAHKAGEALGLTSSQTNYMATAYANPVTFGETPEDLQAARFQLHSDYAMRDDEGNVIINEETNMPELGGNKEFVLAMESRLGEASKAGENAGAMLAPIAAYNSGAETYGKF